MARTLAHEHADADVIAVHVRRAGRHAALDAAARGADHRPDRRT